MYVPLRLENHAPQETRTLIAAQIQRQLRQPQLPPHHLQQLQQEVTQQ